MYSERPASVDTSFLTQCLFYDTIAALRDTTCASCTHAASEHIALLAVRTHPQTDELISVNDWPGTAHICQCSVSVPDRNGGKHWVKVNGLGAVKSVDGIRWLTFPVLMCQRVKRGGQWWVVNREDGFFFLHHWLASRGRTFSFLPFNFCISDGIYEKICGL